MSRCFNTQPPEGGWTRTRGTRTFTDSVSTHSRLKAAGIGYIDDVCGIQVVSTHSRLKAAGSESSYAVLPLWVSTHSRLKAAGGVLMHPASKSAVSTHSRLKAAGDRSVRPINRSEVSTHSRLKAAGQEGATLFLPFDGFNTQPPEGGWQCLYQNHQHLRMFQHTAA